MWLNCQETLENDCNIVLKRHKMFLPYCRNEFGFMKVKFVMCSYVPQIAELGSMWMGNRLPFLLSTFKKEISLQLLLEWMQKMKCAVLLQWLWQLEITWQVFCTILLSKNSYFQPLLLMWLLTQMYHPFANKKD